MNVIATANTIAVSTRFLFAAPAPSAPTFERRPCDRVAESGEIVIALSDAHLAGCRRVYQVNFGAQIALERTSSDYARRSGLPERAGVRGLSGRQGWAGARGCLGSRRWPLWRNTLGRSKVGIVSV
jgi:hypothetical protein